MDTTMKEIMTKPEMLEAMEFVRGKMEEDAETSVLMKAVSSIESAYEVAKKYVTVKFETFKKVCASMMEYFEEDKVALGDEVLDAVSGGWSLSKFWNNVVVGTIVAVCTVAGAAVGTALTAGTGAGIAGFLAGGALGFGLATVICDKCGLQFE